LAKQLTVADAHRLVGLQLGHEDDRRLVRAGRRVPVYAVVRGIQLATGEPFPERGVARIEDRVPGLVPVQQVRVLLEAVWVVVFLETLQDGRVVGVCLPHERLRRVVVLLLAPVHGYLRLGDLRLWGFCHAAPPAGRWLLGSGWAWLAPSLRVRAAVAATATMRSGEQGNPEVPMAGCRVPVSLVTPVSCRVVPPLTCWGRLNGTAAERPRIGPTLATERPASAPGRQTVDTTDINS